MKTKVCKECRHEKPITEFHRDKDRKDGYCQRCRNCKGVGITNIYSRSGHSRPIYEVSEVTTNYLFNEKAREFMKQVGPPRQR